MLEFFRDKFFYPLFQIFFCSLECFLKGFKTYLLYENKLSFVKMFPERDLLPNQYLLPLRMILKMKVDSPDLITASHTGIPSEGKKNIRNSFSKTCEKTIIVKNGPQRSITRLITMFNYVHYFYFYYYSYNYVMLLPITMPITLLQPVIIKIIALNNGQELAVVMIRRKLL